LVQYEFTKTKHCVLAPSQLPVTSYNHDKWEMHLASVGTEVREGETFFNPVSVGGEAVKEDETAVNPASVGGEEDKGNESAVNSFQARVFDLNMVKNLIHAEIAAKKLPKVVFISEKDVVLAKMTGLDTSDPMLAMQHPSEATVQHALSLLATATSNGHGNNSVALKSGDEGNEVTVTIGKLGTYSRKALQAFGKNVPTFI